MSGWGRVLAGRMFVFGLTPIGKGVKAFKVMRTTDKVIGVAKEGQAARRVVGAADVIKGTSETIPVKNIKSEADIIAERAKGLDLTSRETPYKIMGSKKIKQLNEKAKNRTITKEEWKQLTWNKRFKRRRDNGVDDFWEQERGRLLNGESPTRVWTEMQAKDIVNGNHQNLKIKQ
ncbi:hypothetical protein [Fictibacillus sp. S7]|uniref:hypothetical protein n=1 Tax=Fictibacillus sp. S7 TaxID=2212476 RepID=UPI001F51967E